MKTLFQTSAIIAAMAAIPAAANAQTYHNSYNPHQACKKAEDKKQIIGGLIGAVAGGVLGSQVSGNGARTEGSAIGAIVGGLAGAGIADKSIDCDPVYPAASTSTYSSYGETETVYGSAQYGGQAYNQGYNQSYDQGYNQGLYQDRITVSNHPVYSDPTYGAQLGYGGGAVSQGRTYNASTITYPPRAHPANGYITRSEGDPWGQTFQRSQPEYITTSYQQPAYQPRYQPVQTQQFRHARHFHGKYECHDLH